MKRTELKRGTKPLARRTPLKARNAKRGGSRFPKRRDPAYCRFIRSLPCVGRGRYVVGTHGVFSGLPVECAGPIECAHLKSRGAGGDDVGNTFPACRRHHRQQHDVGIRTFQRTHKVNLPGIVASLANLWVSRYPGEPKAGQNKEAL